jgi:hypothetical protein
MKTVVLQGIELKLAYNLRSLFIYEEIAGKPYTGEKTVENYMLMYAMLLANNEAFSLSFDEFINECDADLGLYQVFVEVLTEQGKRASAFLNNKKKVQDQ